MDSGEICETFDCPPGELTGRREARRRLRRETILDVAQRTFMEQGYAGTKMSAIAAELGGSKGTLWSYFPAKDQLFAAVLDRATEAYQQQLALILKLHDEVEHTLLRFARGYLQRVTSPPSLALYRLIMAEAARFPETGQIFYKRAVTRTQVQLAAYLAQEMESGSLRSDDPRRAAQQLVALCTSGGHPLLLSRMVDSIDADMIEADAAHAVAVFMRAYGV